MKTPTLHEANRSITQHAVLRLAQRGVCKKALKLLTLHGIDVPAGSGSVRRELRQQQVVDPRCSCRVFSRVAYGRRSSGFRPS
jgi:hypothetical protein